MKLMMKFRIIFVLALLLQLVAIPLQSLAAEVDTKAPTWVMPINYVALGDSLAFGINSDNLPGEGYADFLAQSLSATNVLKTSNKGFSYPGYKASDVLKDLNENVTKPILGLGHESKDAELSKSIADANLITISVGANDVLQYFKIDPTTGLPQIDLLGLTSAIQQVGVDYNQILKGIYAINPTVQVYVMGYYNSFPHLAPELQPQIEQLVVGLNGSIQAGMKGTSAVFVPISEAIATDFDAYLPNPKNIHLSEAGYKVVATEFSNQLKENYNWLPQDALTAEVKNETTVTLNWKSAVDDQAVTGYIVYNGKEKVGQVGGDVNTFDVESLEANTSYTFTVTAVDEAANESTLNPTASITVGSQHETPTPTPTPTPAFFSDIENHWAKEFIEQAVAVGIVKGYGDGTFKPDKELTRAQATSILVRALDLKADQAAPFKDIDKYAQITQAEIAAAYQYGIVKGNNGEFKPSAPVTHAQLALMVKRAYELVNGGPYTATDSAVANDLAKYDAETQKAIAMLYDLHIIDGDFAPGIATTRAQATKIFVSYFTMTKK